MLLLMLVHRLWLLLPMLLLLLLLLPVPIMLPLALVPAASEVAAGGALEPCEAAPAFQAAGEASRLSLELWAAPSAEPPCFHSS